jgi:Ca2+-binding RTX toxin-like protein
VTRRATGLLVLLVALLVVLPSSTGAAPAAAAVIDVPARIVMDTWELPNPPVDPNRCVTVDFVEFDDVPGAGAYTAVVFNQALSANQTFTAGPTFFPGDAFTMSSGTQTKTFFAPAGSHRIVLGWDSSGQGCRGAPRFSLVSMTTTVQNAPPVASFTWAESSSDPLTIAFDGTGSTDDERIDTWEWSFGDGQTGTGETTSHTYESAGTYQVSLTVTDNEAATDTDQQDVDVTSCSQAAELSARTRAPSLAARTGGATQVQEEVSTFKIVVRNTAGEGVRNAIIDVFEGCTRATAQGDPTDRDGVAFVAVSHEPGATFTFTPRHGSSDPAVVESGPSTTGTKEITFTLLDSCLGRPITVIGTDEADTLELYSGDRVDASFGNDVLTPASGETGFVVCGGSGDDQILLANGSVLEDFVDGGDDNDTIETGAGNDRITAGEGTDVVLAGDDDDIVDGGIGDDTISGGAGCDGLTGGDGNDTLRGDGGVNAPVSGDTGCAGGGLDGGNDDDRILGGPERDLLSGGLGCDGILGGPGPDTIAGGDNSDSPLPFGCDLGGLDGGAGPDLVDGNQGVDTITGGGGNDQLRGGTEPDQIAGAGGCDMILGEEGDDVLDGGPGNDGAPASGCSFPGGLSGGISGGPGNDTVDGGPGIDRLRGDGDCDRLLGGSGNTVDAISGGDGDDNPNACAGGGIFGNDGADVLAGDDGNDYVDGGSGRDIVDGGGGADTIHGGDGSDDIDGDGTSSSPGRDTIHGEGARDTIRGGDEPSPECRSGDVIFGGDGHDVIHGGGGGDALIGGSGGDDLYGEGGCDDLYGGTEGDLLEGGENPDTTTELLWGEGGDDTIRGGPGQDALQGGAGFDLLSGGRGVDVLEGGVTTGLPSPTLPPDRIRFQADETFAVPDWLDGGPHGDSCAQRPLDVSLSCDVLPIGGNVLWAVFVTRLQPQP